MNTLKVRNKYYFLDYGILALNSESGNIPIMIDSSGMSHTV